MKLARLTRVTGRRPVRRKAATPTPVSAQPAARTSVIGHQIPPPSRCDSATPRKKPAKPSPATSTSPISTSRDPLMDGRDGRPKPKAGIDSGSEMTTTAASATSMPASSTGPGAAPLTMPTIDGMVAAISAVSGATRPIDPRESAA